MKRSKEWWVKNLDLIRKIVKKAGERGMLGHNNINRNHLIDVITEVTEVNDLDLEKLLGFKGFDFSHDVAGIFNKTDDDGNFKECFWPRCGSVKEEK